MKRKTIIIDDSRHEELHAEVFGPYKSHRFSGKESPYNDHVDLSIGLNHWNNLGKPTKVRVTITVVE